MTRRTIVKEWTLTVVVILLLCITVSPVEKRWADAETDLALCVMSFLLVGGMMVLLFRKLVMVTVCDLLVAVWMAYYVVRVMAGGEYPCRTVFLKTVETFLLYGSLRMLFQCGKVSEKTLVVGIMIGGCYEALLGLMQVYDGESRNSRLLMTGSFLNSGPYAAYLMMGVVIGICCWKEKVMIHATEHKGMALGLLLMSVVLLGTGSRAAFIGVAVVALWNYRDRWRRYAILCAAVLSAISIALYFLKQGSADGRLLIGQAALASWMRAPWLGVGINGFCHAVADGMENLYVMGRDLSSAGVTDYSYNVLLKILVEQGLLGVVFAVAVTVSALRGLGRCSRSLFYCMVSLLLFSMFSYPFDLQPYNVLAVMVVAWGESNEGKSLDAVGRKPAMVILCGMVMISGCAYRFVKEGKEADRQYELIRGPGSESLLQDFQDLLPLEEDHVEYMFDYGKALRVAGRYQDSNAILRQGARCSADPMFHVLIGNNCKDMGYPAMAERAYRKAYAVMPNRLYPLYKLMLLYHETGLRMKERSMAEKILGMKPKVESPATKEMKEQARKTLLERI